MRTVTAGALAVGLLLSFGASSAAATPVQATWSSNGPAKLHGSLQLELNGGTPITCSITANGFTAATLFLTPTYTTALCRNGGILRIWLRVGGLVDAGVYSVFVLAGDHPTTSPYGGTFSQNVGVVVPFANGDSGTPSKIVFSNTQIAVNQGTSFGPVTATGSLDATTAADGLLTLN